MQGDVSRVLDGGQQRVALLVKSTMSSEALAAQSQTYRRAAAVSATPGDALLVSNVSTAGTINVTLANGGVLVLTVPLGSTVLPFGVTAATLGTAVGGTFQSLFFT